MFTSTHDGNNNIVKALCGCEWIRRSKEWDSTLSEFSKIVNEPNDSDIDATFWIDIFEIFSGKYKR